MIPDICNCRYSIGLLYKKVKAERIHFCGQANWSNPIQQDHMLHQATFNLKIKEKENHATLFSFIQAELSRSDKEICERRDRTGLHRPKHICTVSITRRFTTQQYNLFFFYFILTFSDFHSFLLE